MTCVPLGTGPKPVTRRRPVPPRDRRPARRSRGTCADRRRCSSPSGGPIVIFASTNRLVAGPSCRASPSVVAGDGDRGRVGARRRRRSARRRRVCREHARVAVLTVSVHVRCRRCRCRSPGLAGVRPCESASGRGRDLGVIDVNDAVVPRDRCRRDREHVLVTDLVHAVRRDAHVRIHEPLGRGAELPCVAVGRARDVDSGRVGIASPSTKCQIEQSRSR